MAVPERRAVTTPEGVTLAVRGAVDVYNDPIQFDLVSKAHEAARHPQSDVSHRRVDEQILGRTQLLPVDIGDAPRDRDGDRLGQIRRCEIDRESVSPHQIRFPLELRNRSA